MNGNALASLLDTLQAERVIDAEQRGALAALPHTPWWLASLLAAAAWVAALFILSAFFAPLLALGDSRAARAIGGTALIGLALFLFQRRGVFTDQMALAFSLAGQALLASAVTGRFFDHGGDTVAAVVMTVATALMVAPASLTHRVICALLALASLAYLIGPGTGLALFGVATTAVAVALWLSRSRWAAHPRAPIVKAVAHATTVVALCLAPYGTPRSTLEPFAAVVGIGSSRPDAVPALYFLGLALILLGTVGRVTRGAAWASRTLAVAAALAFAVAAHAAPGLVAAATVVVAAFHARHAAWVVLALAFAVLYVGEYYYSLQATLLTKSLVLLASGALLLGVRQGAHALARRKR